MTLFNQTPLSKLERDNNIMIAVDKLNRHWGRDTLRVASMGMENRLKMRQNRKTPRYTTNWEELLNVRL